VKGSAGYVAIELVSGKHTGTMTRGMPQLTITVVPESDTGELVGLMGTMSIHLYAVQWPN